MKHAELLAALNKHTQSPHLNWVDSSDKHGWTTTLTIKTDDGELFFHAGFPENNEEGEEIRYSLMDDEGEVHDSDSIPANDEAIAEFCGRIDFCEMVCQIVR